MSSKIIKPLLISLFLGLFLQSTVIAQSISSSEKFKAYYNEVVLKVEKEDDFDQKRAILNDSFENMITAYERVSSMKGISAEDQQGLAEMHQRIMSKLNELNGIKGYDLVADVELDNFANYVQNDLEQANRTITISLTTLLLIILILILI